MKKNHSKQLSLNNYSFDFKTALNNKDLNIDNNIKNIKSNVPKINRLNLRFSNNFNKPNNNNIINTSINTNKRNHKDYRQIDHIKTLYSKKNSKDVVKEKLSKKYISNNYNKKDHINNLYSSTNNNNNNEINEIEEKAYFSRKKKIDVDKLFKKRKVETQKKFFGNSLNKSYSTFFSKKSDFNDNNNNNNKNLFYINNSRKKYINYKPSNDLIKINNKGFYLNSEKNENDLINNNQNKLNINLIQRNLNNKNFQNTKNRIFHTEDNNNIKKNKSSPKMLLPHQNDHINDLISYKFALKYRDENIPIKI